MLETLHLTGRDAVKDYPPTNRGRPAARRPHRVLSSVATSESDAGPQRVRRIIRADVADGPPVWKTGMSDAEGALNAIAGADSHLCCVADWLLIVIERRREKRAVLRDSRAQLPPPVPD